MIQVVAGGAETKTQIASDLKGWDQMSVWMPEGDPDLWTIFGIEFCSFRNGKNNLQH